MKEKLTYGSICSGIEAATVAWHPLGWAPAFFAEIEAFPSAVLAHRYPHVENRGDITAYQDWNDAAIDVLVGGTPCQSFSVAGLRRGMADPRGNLALTYLAIADRYRPEWLVWENVPGVLSSNGGRDFGAFLGGLVELGYGFAYRVLDAQYVRVDGYGRAVPQRRRRVFVVGNSRSWRRAAAVLFERESLSGNSAPRREAGERVAGTTQRGFGGSGENVARTLTTGEHQRQDWETCTMIAHALRGEGLDASEDGTGRSTPIVPVIARTLTRGAESAGKGGYAGRRQEDDDNLVAHPYTLAIRGRDGQPDLEYRQDGTANAILTPNGGRAGIGVGAIAHAMPAPIDMRQASRGDKITNNRASGSGGAPGHGIGDVGDPAFTVSERGQAVAFDLRNGTQDDVAMSLQSGGMGDERGLCPNAIPHTLSGWAVRRLTPTECERLQGFPDGYTAIPYRNKPAADGPRYKALGNSMAVNVMRWIGHRIGLVNSLTTARARAA